MPGPAARAVVLFYAGWFATILGAGAGLGWIGPVAAVAIGTVHLALSGARAAEVRLLAIATTMGLVVDSALRWSGFVDYALAPRYPPLAPPWIIALWLLLATTIRPALGFLSGRPLLAAVLGAVGGAASYAAGARFHAVSFPRGYGPAMSALAVVWAVAMPLLVWSGGLSSRRQRATRHVSSE